jgi:hypothetical protein
MTLFPPILRPGRRIVNVTRSARPLPIQIPLQDHRRGPGIDLIPIRPAPLAPIHLIPRIPPLTYRSPLVIEEPIGSLVIVALRECGGPSLVECG